MKILRIFAVLLGLAMLGPIPQAKADGYDAAVSGWKDYKDVADWLDRHFVFDTARLDENQNQVRSNGPTALKARAPGALYETSHGYCVDAATFTVDALNKINLAYKADTIFIKNGGGKTQHWVAGFWLDGKIMIIDYGPGPDWLPIRGIHGPYDSLDQYKDYLNGRGLKHFVADEVRWRPFPGTLD